MNRQSVTMVFRTYLIGVRKNAPRKKAPQKNAPEKIAPRKNASQENCPPSPKEKKRKLTPENLISQLKCNRKRRDDKKID